MYVTPAHQNASDRHGYALLNASGARDIRSAIIDSKIPGWLQDLAMRHVRRMQDNHAETMFTTYAYTRDSLASDTGLASSKVTKGNELLQDGAVTGYRLVEVEHGQRRVKGQQAISTSWRWERTGSGTDRAPRTAESTASDKRRTAIEQHKRQQIAVDAVRTSRTVSDRLHADVVIANLMPFKATVVSPTPAAAPSLPSAGISGMTMTASANTAASDQRHIAPTTEHELQSAPIVTCESVDAAAAMAIRRDALKARLLAELHEREAVPDYDWDAAIVARHLVNALPPIGGSDAGANSTLNAPHDSTSMPARRYVDLHDCKGVTCRQDSDARCGCPQDHEHDGIMYAGWLEQEDTLYDKYGTRPGFWLT